MGQPTLNSQSKKQTVAYKKIPYSSIKPLLMHFDMSDEARAFVDPDMEPVVALTHLRKQQLNLDAVNLLAYCLPRRESIWWACQCITLRQAVLSPVQLECVKNAKLWLQDPTEVLRRRSEYYGKRLGSDCGPGWLALAVFFNGSGSIIASGEPQVMPKPYLYAAAVSGAVNLMAAKPEQTAAKLATYYRLVFDSALDIARGGQGVLQGAMMDKSNTQKVRAIGQRA